MKVWRAVYVVMAWLLFSVCGAAQELPADQPQGLGRIGLLVPHDRGDRPMQAGP